MLVFARGDYNRFVYKANALGSPVENGRLEGVAVIEKRLEPLTSFGKRRLGIEVEQIED